MNYQDSYLVIAGPSYVERWLDTVSKRVLEPPTKGTSFVGYPAHPVWSPRIWQDVGSVFVPNKSKIIVIVGDFRFGNNICGDKNKGVNFPFSGDQYGIDRSYISPSYDREMRERCMAALEAYVNAYGAAVKFIFWALAGRQIMDMLLKRHIDQDGKYRHPVWETDHLHSCFSNNIIDLRRLHDQPIADTIRLFIDDDLHHSFAGYRFLEKLSVSGESVADSLRFALGESDSLLANSIGLGSISGIITGRSIWIETLRRYIGLSGLQNWAKKGILVQSAESIDDEQLNRFENSPRAGVLIVSNEIDLKEFCYSSPRFHRVARLQNVMYVPWEASIISSMQASRSHFQSKWPIKILTDKDFADVWGIAPRSYQFRELFERGLRGEPNLRGLRTILDAFRSWLSSGGGRSGIRAHLIP